jgi:hypothetical protein
MNSFIKSHAFRVIVVTCGVLIVMITIFRAGMAVGYRRAVFAVRWGENYEKNFLGPRGGMKMMGNFDDRAIPNTHGSTGKIIRIDTASSTATLILQGNDGTEKSIAVGSSTVIRIFSDEVQFSDLKINDQITVVGSPNEQGQIEAKLIRVFPPNPQQ